MTKHRVTIYAHGTCLEPVGPGGYSAVLYFQDDRKARLNVVTGSYEFITQHRAEMQAVINALRAIKQPCSIRIVTDSPFVVEGLTGKHSTKEAGRLRDEADLWAELFLLCERHLITLDPAGGLSKSEEGRCCLVGAHQAATSPQLAPDYFLNDVDLDSPPFLAEFESIQNYKAHVEFVRDFRHEVLNRGANAA